MLLPQGVTWHDEGNAALVLDLRHYPICISTWMGTPGLDIATAYVEWTEALHRQAEWQEDRIVLVADGTRGGRPPGPVRHRLAESRTPPCVLDYFVVVSNPAVRGAVTAISWLAGDRLRMRVVPELSAGLRGALVVLDRNAIPRPSSLEPDRYEPPEQLRRVAR
jgi:hypothetical protein